MASTWGKRVGWLLLLWFMSVAALGIVALLLRQLVRWAGLAGS